MIGPSLRKRWFAPLLCSLAGVLLAFACGGKSESDFTGGSAGAGGSASGGLDASAAGDPSSGGEVATAGTRGVGATGGTGTTAGRGGMTATGGRATGTGGTFPFPLDGGAAECVDCVTMSCPQAQACFDDPTCVQGAICAATTCTQADGFACLLGCFNGDATTAYKAYNAFTCVVNQCGTDCASAFGQ